MNGSTLGIAGKVGIGIVVVSLGVSSVLGIPKIKQLSGLHSSYIELQNNIETNRNSIEQISSDLESEQEKIAEVRSSDSNPYSIEEVTKQIKKLSGTSITSIDVYNSSNDSGDVLLQTLNKASGVETLTSDSNMLVYHLKVKEVKKVVREIGDLKIYASNLISDADKDTIDLTVRFVGGE